MTLVLMGISSNGIVAAADTRRTSTDKTGYCSYIDSTVKVLKFNNFIIHYFGNSYIDNVLVGDWLLMNLSDKSFKKPVSLLHYIENRLPSELKSDNSNKSITFLCGMYVDGEPSIFQLISATNKIECMASNLGNVFRGGSGMDLAGAILDCGLDIQVSNLDATEMEDLFELIGKTVVGIAKISRNQTIGGEILTETLLRPTSDL